MFQGFQSIGELILGREWLEQTTQRHNGTFQSIGNVLVGIAEKEWATQALLSVMVLLATLMTILLILSPSQYDVYKPDLILEKPKDGEKKRTYPYTDEHGCVWNEEQGIRFLKPKTTVQIVVLGDIGRSPRMQYHAISIAKNHGKVDLIGYKGKFR